MQCPVCHQEVAPQTAFCNHCGASLAAAAPGAAPPAYSAPTAYTAPTDYPPPAYPPPPAGASGLSPNAAAAISYVTILPAIFFLAIDPYNKIPLVRFHSYQSIGLCIVWFAAWVVLVFLQILLHFIPFTYLIFGLMNAVVGFGLFIVWVLVILKAVKGEYYKLPLIGDFAERQARS
jgi:uncharacterized membrane protein